MAPAKCSSVATWKNRVSALAIRTLRAHVEVRVPCADQLARVIASSISVAFHLLGEHISDASLGLDDRCGAVGVVAPGLRRRREIICTVNAPDQTRSSWTRVACRRCSRLSCRWGALRKATSSAVFAPWSTRRPAPVGSVSFRVRRSSRQPEKILIAAAFWLARGQGAGSVQPPNDRAHPRQELAQVEGLRDICRRPPSSRPTTRSISSRR